MNRTQSATGAVCLFRMNLLPPQVDNGLAEPPTGAGALWFAACHCSCCALRQPVKVRDEQRAIIHHTGDMKYVKHGNILFKHGAMHLRNTSMACSPGAPPHAWHNRFLRLLTICSCYSVCLRLPVACGWNQLSSCLTLVSDASQLFIMSSSASSNINVSHHGNRLVSPPGAVGFSVSKPDISEMWQNSQLTKKNKDKANIVLIQADKGRV